MKQRIWWRRIIGFAIPIVSLLALLSATACAPRPWPTQLLDGAVHHSTQADIEQELGSPDLIARGPSRGSTVWLYRFTRGPHTSVLFECRDYRLTFDAHKRLNRWRQLDCTNSADGYDPEREKLELKEP